MDPVDWAFITAQPKLITSAFGRGSGICGGIAAENSNSYDGTFWRNCFVLWGSAMNSGEDFTALEESQATASIWVSILQLRNDLEVKKKAWDQNKKLNYSAYSQIECQRKIHTWYLKTCIYHRIRNWSGNWWYGILRPGRRSRFLQKRDNLQVAMVQHVIPDSWYIENYWYRMFADIMGRADAGQKQYFRSIKYPSWQNYIFGGMIYLSIQRNNASSSFRTIQKHFGNGAVGQNIQIWRRKR